MNVALKELVVITEYLISVQTREKGVRVIDSR